MSPQKKVVKKSSPKSSGSAKPTPADPKSVCGRVKRILNTTSPKSKNWRSLSIWWGNNC